MNRVKVIRTINSITLQHDEEEIKTEHPLNIDDCIVTEETPETFEMLVSDAISCKSCGRIETNDIELEIHEFLQHTSFGIQIENEIENCKTFMNETNLFLICSICNSQVENSDILLLHFLEDHCSEILTHINAILMKNFVDTKQIEKYLNYMRDCLNGSNQESVQILNERTYFFETYDLAQQADEESNDGGEFVESFDHNIQEQSDIDMNEDTLIVPEKKKSEKSNELSNNDKEWLRQELSRGKFTMNNESGSKTSVFHCMASKSCNYVSNSSPGLRYHLLIKHLNNRHNLIEEPKSDIKNEFLTTSHLQKSQSNKNCCTECCLKFKDHRSFHVHKNCHELFSIVAQRSSFPMCNTCNKKFIDEELLNIHLNRHDLRENLNEHILVDEGAVRSQGKLLRTEYERSCAGETSETEFSWKCGHCENKNFINEDFCNFHMIMNHVTCFTCPIDRMEFKGFKSVSLFIHHLRNKHPELFPNVSFKCTFCHNEFSTIYDKLQHMKNCDSKQFQCDHCEKRFFKKNDLAAHLRLVTGEIQFECKKIIQFKA